MLERIRDSIKTVEQSILHFAKWFFLAVLVGIIGGTVGGVFHELLDLVAEVREGHKWLLYFLPLGGIVIAALYKLGKIKGKLDTNRVLEAIRTDEKIPFVMVPLIFVSTLISHLLGASVGREGAALQLGGSIGYNVGKVFRLSKIDLHMIVMAGMSSVFAALFGTPLTAAVFAIEVTCIGAIQYSGLFPCVVSSFVAYRIALFFGVSPVRFSGLGLASTTGTVIAQVMVLALLCALVSILFCLVLRYSEKGMKKLLPNRYLRAMVGGLLVIILAAVLRTTEYNGAGMDVVARAMTGRAKPEAFLLKIIFTAICIGAGFKGGEIVPTLFIGATFGCVVGPLLGIPAGFSAAVGFIALFCGVVNCPMASLILALEVFGSNIWIFAAVCSVSFLLSGHFGLYQSQKFAVSKLTDEAMEE